MTDDTDDTFNLSRRKLLGAAGTIGGAAAVGGMGTMAMFSDEETYANNQLVAGQLDLKIAWQELYFGAAAESAFETGAVSTANLFAEDTFRAESYPRPGAGVSFENLAAQDACAEASFYADAPDDLDPTNSGSYRSMNGDTYNGRRGVPKALISIQDAKPGDFGFTRFRLLLCNNPGYIWTRGGIQSLGENGINEPESKDPDQSAGATAASDGELADEIRVRLVQATSGAAIDSLLGGLTASSGRELSEQFIQLFDLANAPTLREFTNALSQGVGFPLDADPFSGSGAGSVHTQSSDVFVYDVTGSTAQQQQQDRQCFEADGGAGQLGLIWALPVDHANEIQSDSVAVDLSYYTEQCRHNDGSGTST